jgi:hypothetical protein
VLSGATGAGVPETMAALLDVIKKTRAEAEAAKTEEAPAS